MKEEELLVFKYGTADTEGFITWIGNVWLWSQGKKNWGSKLNCVENISCPKCNGTGLGEQAMHTTVDGKIISELEEMQISGLLNFLKNADIKKSPSSFIVKAAADFVRRRNSKTVSGFLYSGGNGFNYFCI